MLFERWRQGGLLRRCKEIDTPVPHADRKAAGYTDPLNHITFSVKVLFLKYNEWFQCTDTYKNKNKKIYLLQNISFIQEAEFLITLMAQGMSMNIGFDLVNIRSLPPS